ncbi:MAG: hypothetical protein LAT57_00150 [Balneolales bacterium]|nr:hypothetical protein [Balneolales bacterium]
MNTQCNSCQSGFLDDSKWWRDLIVNPVIDNLVSTMPVNQGGNQTWTPPFTNAGIMPISFNPNTPVQRTLPEVQVTARPARSFATIALTGVVIAAAGYGVYKFAKTKKR